MRKYITFLLTLFLLAVGTVQAQSYRTFSRELRQIMARELFRIGPFRVDPGISLQRIGYDGNVYYQRETDEPVRDYTATFALPVRVHLLWRNYLILTLNETPSYIYYREQSRERRWLNRFYPEFKLLLMNRFVISGSYEKRSRRVRVSSEFDARVNVHNQQYIGSIFYETARETSFGVTASSNEISYEDVDIPGEEIGYARALNRKEQNISGEFYYRIFANSFFFLKGGYTDYKFENPATEFRNSCSYQASTGIRFPLLGRINGTLELGYKELIPRGSGREGFSGLFGNTDINIRLGRFTFSMEYGRNANFTYWSNNIYYIDNSIGAGLSFYLTRFLRLDYEYTYREGDYPEAFMARLPDGSIGEINRHDQYYIHRVGIVFRIIRNVGIGLDANFWDRDSNLLGADRDRFFVGGYLTYDF